MQKLMSAFGLSKESHTTPEQAATPAAPAAAAAASPPPASGDGVANGSAVSAASPEEDCFACSVPCHEYPADIMSKIDYDDDIGSSVKSYDRQILICTGISGSLWPSRVDDERGSYSSFVSDHVRKLKDSAGLKINVNSSEDESKDEKGEVIKNIHEAKKADMILFPDMIRFHQVDETKLKQLCEYIGSPVAKQWLETLRSGNHASSSSSSSTSSSSSSNGSAAGHATLPSSVPGLSLPHTVLTGVHVLVCVHMKRDNRCGVTAPILLQQFSDVSSSLKISPSSLTFHKISHVGGHKWAANVIVYPYGIWLGKVKPKHAEGILKTFVLNKGKNAEKMEEIYRGNCRTKGIPAW